MPRAKQRTPELRRHVLRVALETLADEGVSGFTTRKVAQAADTSVPAVYELFGARAGLVREVFFEGFRRLRARFDDLDGSDDPRADLVRTVEVIRAFVRANPVLAQVMFSHPFADFDPGPEEAAAGAAVRRCLVHSVRRCIDHRVVDGNEVDIAHALLALTQGLALQETAGWLGRSRASVDRRWRLAIDALLQGLSP